MRICTHRDFKGWMTLDKLSHWKIILHWLMYFSIVLLRPAWADLDRVSRLWITTTLNSFAFNWVFFIGWDSAVSLIMLFTMTLSYKSLSVDDISMWWLLYRTKNSTTVELTLYSFIWDRSLCESGPNNSLSIHLVKVLFPASGEP